MVIPMLMLTTTAALVVLSFFFVLNNEKIKLEATAASSTRNLLAAAVYQGPTPPSSVQLKGQHYPSTLGINPLFLTCLANNIKLLAQKKMLLRISSVVMPAGHVSCHDRDLGGPNHPETFPGGVLSHTIHP